ncbi:MAG: hypothetical protein AAFP13_12180 [Pseudomonadota bacterium]
MQRLQLHWPVLLTLPLAFILYGSGVYYGLPQHFDTDEFAFIGGAGRLLSDRTLDPGWYGSPAQTLMYLLAVIFAGVIGFGLLTGRFESLSAAQLAYRNDTTPFIASGRFAMCLIAVAQIAVTYLVMRKLRIRGWVSALLLLSLVFSPLLVSFASIIRMDILQSTLQMTIVLLCISALDGPRPARGLIIAGAVVGLSVSTKYPGVVSCIPIIVTAGVLLARARFTLSRSIGVLLASAGAALVASFLSGPFLFLNFAGVLENVAFEARSAQAGATSAGFFPALGYYLLEILPENLGWPVVALAALGVLRATRDAPGWIVLSMFFSYVAFISALSLSWERWALPLFPLAVVLAGFGAEALLSVSQRARIAAVAVVAAAMVGSLALTGPGTVGSAVARWQNDDTRIIADRLLADIVSNGGGVAIETQAPSLDTARYGVYYSQDGALLEWSERSDLRRPIGYMSYLANGWEGDFDAFRAAMEARGVDYLILTGYSDLFFEDRALFPEDAEFYAQLLEASEPVCEIGRSFARLGPEISIRRLTEPGAAVPPCPSLDQELAGNRAAQAAVARRE